MHDVEFAVRADGTVPAQEFLELLRDGRWPNDPDEDGDPPWDEQIRDEAKFWQMIRKLADRGLPTGGRQGAQTNQLQEGIWEFKRGAKRLTWYDTDGSGGHAPKLRIDDRAESNYPDDDDWWFPEFDTIIRLGHSFPKTSQKTSHFDINEALATRTEDLNHDAP